MIDLSPVSQAPAATGPSAPAKAGAAAPPGRFGETLGAFLDARDAARTPTAAADDDRQDPAADGNAVPPATENTADDTAPLWMPLVVAPPVPPVPIQAAAAGGDALAPAGASTSAASTAQPVSAPPVAPDGATAAMTAAMTPGPGAAPTVDPAIAAALDAAFARAPAESNDTRREPGKTDATASPAASLASAAPAIAVGTAPQPAGRVFADAIATAWRDRDTRDEKTETPTGSTILGPTPMLATSAHGIVQAAGDTGGTALDLTQDTGLQRMVDHIETLRDGADAGDTRIRLIPDSLGGVDVTVRQQGERVHVHFTTQHEATRALIAEAQPRLTELAAARGVQIGDTSVSADSGSGGDAAPQPRTAPPATLVPRAVTAETETQTDARVA